MVNLDNFISLILNFLFYDDKINYHEFLSQEYNWLIKYKMTSLRPKKVIQEQT